MEEDYKIDKLFGQTGIFAGYTLIVSGIVITFFSLSGLILLTGGIFMAFTYEGTLIDFDNRKIKSYTCFFGLIKAGKWYNVDNFNRFSIYRSARSSTTYSRGNVPLTLKKSDIRLALISRDGSKKIIVNKYNSFETARKEMADLIKDLKLKELSDFK